MGRSVKRSTRTQPRDSGRRFKQRSCQLCAASVKWVDYKDVELLRRYVSDRGKIRSKRVTGNCQRHQKAIANAVKTARELALLPYTQRPVTERTSNRRGYSANGDTAPSSRYENREGRYAGPDGHHGYEGREDRDNRPRREEGDQPRDAATREAPRQDGERGRTDRNTDRGRPAAGRERRGGSQRGDRSMPGAGGGRARGGEGALGVPEVEGTASRGASGEKPASTKSLLVEEPVSADPAVTAPADAGPPTPSVAPASDSADNGPEVG